MKTCPICQSQCFDDMEVCFGCMHRFAADAQPLQDEVTSDDALASEEKKPSVPEEKKSPDVIETPSHHPVVSIAAPPQRPVVAERPAGAMSLGQQTPLYPGYQLVIQVVAIGSDHTCTCQPQ